MHIVKRVWWWLLDLMFPRTCSGCGREGVVLCAACRGGLFVGRSEFLCDGFRVFVACEKSEILRRIVHQFKYKYSEELAYELAELLRRRLTGLSMEGAWLTPVPLYWKRERERGFNQSRMLASLVSEILNVRWVDLLVRTRETQVQATLKKSERVKNVRDAFMCNVRCVDAIPHIVFILDDVITSGSTFLECAKILKAAGVERVYGIMLSHGLS